jgi:hypothetical protein
MLRRLKPKYVLNHNSYPCTPGVAEQMGGRSLLGRFKVNSDCTISISLLYQYH